MNTSSWLRSKSVHHTIPADFITGNQHHDGIWELWQMVQHFKYFKVLNSTWSVLERQCACRWGRNKEWSFKILLPACHFWENTRNDSSLILKIFYFIKTLFRLQLNIKPPLSLLSWDGPKLQCITQQGSYSSVLSVHQQDTYKLRWTDIFQAKFTRIVAHLLKS